ncbi:MAG: hypothetical protein ACW986_00910 [Promethearchaeota archaeon]|jgi:hypothetical protein
MVLIMTTTWIPPSQAAKMGELAASEEWQKLLNPEEKNLALLGGVTSTKDGYKSIWVKKVDLENFLINYRGTATRAAYMANNLEGVRYQIEILNEAEDNQAWEEFTGNK